MGGAHERLERMGVRGDVVTPGYFEDAERTAAAIDSDGWLHTQDLAHRDEAGFYRIQGRIDDVINSGAEKLSLLEVDAVLLDHPKVADAATVGRAHDRFGEVPGAFVVMVDQVPRTLAKRTSTRVCVSRSRASSCMTRTA